MSNVTIVEAQDAVKSQSKLNASTLAVFQLRPNDVLEVQTRKGKSKFKTVATYEAGKTYNGLNGIAAAYVHAENQSNVRRVIVPVIERVLVKFAA